MPLFTTDRVDQLFERFMKHQPNRYTDAPEADHIQSILDAEKEKRGRCPMIYRDDRHQRTFEKEAAMRPDSISRTLLAGLYLLTADGNLWNQVKDQISLRRVYVDEMRAQESHRHQLRLFLRRQGHPEWFPHRPAHRDRRPGASLLEVLPDLCTALAIRAYGVEKASRIQFNKEWE